MSLRALIAAVAALAGAGALAQTAAQTDKPSCEGELFEFTATSGGHLTRVTLCGKKDATSAQLVTMFRNAIGALESNDKLDPGRRDELISQLKANIAGLEAKTAAAQATPVAIAPPITKGPTLAEPAASAPLAEYSALPPLPEPKPAALASAAAATAASLPALGKPRLRIDCFDPEDLAGEGPCSSLGRETRVTVRADEALPAGTALRFLRRGDFRAEVDLAQLGTGKSMQFVLPRPVCAGVVESKVEIQVVRRAGPKDSAGQVVDSMGPYLLHC